MQLTSQTDYALRILIYLAMSPERVVTVQEISDFYRLSRNHLVKVVHRLAEIGVVVAIRGRGGGVRLAAAAGGARVGELVAQLEPNLGVVECLVEGRGGNCAVEPVCRLKAAFNRAAGAFLAELDHYTLDDLIRQGPAVSELIGRMAGRVEGEERETGPEGSVPARFAD